MPEQGEGNQPAFTEYTKQQMGSTLGQTAAAAMHDHEPHRRQNQGEMHAPLRHALTTPLAEAHSLVVHQSAHAWTRSSVEADEAAVGGTSSSWSGSYSADEGPHPPDAPSPHSGILHAVSGFRGGRRGDPRLRRFKDAFNSAGTQCPPTNAAVSNRGVLPRREGNSRQQLETRPGLSVSSCWSGRPQAVDNVSGAESAVGVKSVESQWTDVQAFEPQEKQYLRAPPSLAWDATSCNCEQRLWQCDLGSVLQ